MYVWHQYRLTTDLDNHFNCHNYKEQSLVSDCSKQWFHWLKSQNAGLFFRSGTDFISQLNLLLFFLCLFLLLDDLFKKSLRLPNFIPIRFETTEPKAQFGRNVLHVNMPRLTESDFQFDAIVSRCWPCRHFTQKTVATWWVKTKRLAGASSWSIVYMYIRTCSEQLKLSAYIF